MGAKEFTTEEERKRRRKFVVAVGTNAWGDSWQAPMAVALGLPRSRVAQWILQTKDVKPVPARVVVALKVIARDKAAELRRRADALDALPDDEGAPPAQGEPNAEGDAPQDSGPAAASAAFEDDFDMDGFVAQVCSEPRRDLGEIPRQELHWVQSNVAGWVHTPMRRS